MDISVFFKPSNAAELYAEGKHASQLGRKTTFFTGDLEELEGKKIAIIGVCEERNAGDNQGCAKGPDVIRRQFYKLFQCDNPVEKSSIWATLRQAMKSAIPILH